MGETTKADWDSIENRHKPKEAPRCSLCGRPGHTIKNCPKPYEQKIDKIGSE